MTSLSTWPLRERPRERLRELGPSALSDSELIALLPGTGHGKENVGETARRLLTEVGGLERLAGMGPGQLHKLPGVGEATPTRVIAAVELGVRVVEQAARNRTGARFECSADIFETYRARFGSLRQEVFAVIGLNNRNEPICEVIVAKGSVNECRVEPREVFRPLIAEAAARALLIHNHPSGDPTPSPSDLSLTRRLAQVGELLGIPILDHVVIAPFSHSSFRDLGLIDDTSSKSR